MQVERVTSTTVVIRTQKAFVYSYTSTDIRRKQKRFNMISPIIFKTVSLIAVTACLLSSHLQLLDARSTGSERETPFKDQGGHNDTNHLHNETSELHNVTSDPYSSCNTIYNNFIQELLVRLNVTTPCYLGNSSACDVNEETEHKTSSRTDPAKAYGYGFLMAVLVSACSLIGVLVLPLLNKNNEFHSIYKYFYALMIALGTSALFCDAILHLIPAAFGLHNHGHGAGGEEGGHAHHGEGEEEEDKSFIWKGIIVIAGLYLFYLFEVTLHSWNDHHHHHGHQDVDTDSNSDSHEAPSQSIALTNKKESSPAHCVEPTMPHGACRDKSSDDFYKGSILHPRRPPCSCEDETTDDKKSRGKRKYCAVKIKPLAWVIILGDAIHNSIDGLALGAAISQSLSLGVSTMIALILHELPHELGDFAILLSTGLPWYTALFFNFVSALTAVIGFFVGVAVGTSSSEANGWILAVAAGVFTYIALVDLLPELIHVKEKGGVRFLLILMANIGFFLSFVILLLIAIYEEELNTLITV